MASKPCIRVLLLLQLLFVTFSEGKKGGGGCANITCREAPPEAGVCKSVPGIHECCPDFECVASDGTKSKHSGVGSSSHFEQNFQTPGGSGHTESFSSSSFQSSSASGPGALKNMLPMGGLPPLGPIGGGLGPMLPMKPLGHFAGDDFGSQIMAPPKFKPLFGGGLGGMGGDSQMERPGGGGGGGMQLFKPMRFNHPTF